MEKFQPAPESQAVKVETVAPEKEVIRRVEEPAPDQSSVDKVAPLSDIYDAQKPDHITGVEEFMGEATFPSSAADEVAPLSPKYDIHAEPNPDEGFDVAEYLEDPMES